MKKITILPNNRSLTSLRKMICMCSLLVLNAALLHAKSGPVNSNKLNNLVLGGAVWAESDNDGMKHTRFDGSNLMDAGLIGATVRLYADANNDGFADGPVLASQQTNNYGQYTFANLAPGNYVVGVQRPAGNFRTAPVNSIIDPDNNIDEDNNGVIFTDAGELRSLAITLTAGMEPTYDGDNANGNRTLDFAFQPIVNVDKYLYTGFTSIIPEFTGKGFNISAYQPNISYPPTYFSYAYQYKNAAGNWVCFTDGVSVINGVSVRVRGSKGNSISSATSPISFVGNVPPVDILGNSFILDTCELNGLVVRCVLSYGQTADACSMPANNTINSGQGSLNYTHNVACSGNLIAGKTGSDAAEISNQEKVRVFPNPSTGPLQLELNGLKGSYTISLYDQSGRMVSAEKITVAAGKQYHTLNRKSLNSGNYLLQVRNAGDGKIVESKQVMLQ